MKETLIVIPTYNEKENIGRLIAKIISLKVPADILVVDDSSPDGTGQIVQKITKRESSVFLLTRAKKEGLGRAYLAGFDYGIKKGYRKLLSMDADFSHPPEVLKSLIEICDKRMVAIGSRYVEGGKVVGWGFTRYLNSWGANLAVRALLQIRAKDATAGFKCYPIEFLKKLDFTKIQASGYAFQVEMPLRAQEAGFKLKETPITFVDRERGESKIQGELKRSARVVFKLFSQKKTVRQFVKFAIVGAINTLVDWAVFYLAKIVLSSLWPMPTGRQASAFSLSAQGIKQLAKGFSFIVSALSSYIMNRKWTFRSEEAKVGLEASKFILVAFGGFLINSGVFYLVTSKAHWRDIFGLMLATATATLWNFFINKNWTFKPR